MLKIFAGILILLSGFLVPAPIPQAVAMTQESQQKTTVAILGINYKSFSSALQTDCEDAFRRVFRKDNRLAVITAADSDTSVTGTDALATAQSLDADYLLTGELRKIGELIIIRLRFFNVNKETEDGINVNTTEGKLVGETIPAIVDTCRAKMIIKEIPQTEKSNWPKWVIGGSIVAGIAGGVTAAILLNNNGGESELPEPGAIPEDLIGK